MKKNEQSSDKKEEKRVITPAGPRLAKQVHVVNPDEMVTGDEKGLYSIVPSSVKDDVKTAFFIPKDYVLTPGGLRHKSLVHQIDSGHYIDGAGQHFKMIHSLTKKSVADFGKITLKPGVEPLMPKNISLPKQIANDYGSGWITYAFWNNGTGNSINSFTARWTVPQPPADYSGQLIYLFNGLQNSTMIYQPVLQWGYNGFFGGDYWVVASWYADGQNGPAFYTNPVRVNPGDVLIGVMSFASQNGSKFSYNCGFQGIANTNLPIYNVEELNWCCITLEAYNVTKCPDYPASDRTSFNNINIDTRRINLNKTVTILNPTLNWTRVNESTDCDQTTSVVSNSNPGGEVDVFYPKRQFNVTSFKPWSGYKIPNGLWMVGDFNGDGKSDILHAVQGNDYANVWLSKGDGTFTVKQFKPWSGYKIPNGLWMVGDFNGDGKSDILHAVQGNDYANVWLSKGDGTFTVKQFKPWPGYEIPNGLWMVGDFNGNGKSDILHAVQGNDYANVWLSKGDGTFTVKQFKPWSGYKIPNGLWMVGDFNGDGKSDILHAVQGNDYANVWLSKGDGTFVVKQFKPWSGYDIPNGLWMVGDFNGDGKSDVLHAVQNTNYANLWVSKGDGTFDIRPFYPWAGYKIPNGLWMVGDFNGNGKSDIVHAVQGTDYVNVWKSIV